MKKVLLPAVALVTALSACASQPENVVSRSVSTSPYMSMSCSQLTMENNQVVASVNNLTAAQKEKAGNDAAAMAVGMVLFWPALFFLAKGSDQEAALSEAKGRYDAISAVSKAKGCTA